MDTTDTDTLIALTTSLLTVDIPDANVILAAIADCNGSVEAASRKLNKVNVQKRKRGLDEWLKPATKSKRKVSPVRRPITIPSTSPSKPGPSVDLMNILQQPKSTSVPPIPRFLPLTLGTPELVSKHTPCTFHPGILPPELACRLFYAMIDAAERDWHRNQWWLFGRMVESPHRTSFFTRGLHDEQEWGDAAQYWYNGRPAGTCSVFPPVMEEACSFVERIVNEQLRKRRRFPLEWAGEGGWKCNVAGTNCYEGGKESVGPHSDSLTYIGPYPTIASLSLGTDRIFSLREVIPNAEATTRSARTFNIPVTHNSLTIMHASTQEKYKHSVPPQRAIDIFKPAFSPEPSTSEPADTDTPRVKINASTSRINITFRFYRPDFRPHTTPRCKCGVPMILRPDKKGVINGYKSASRTDSESKGLGNVTANRTTSTSSQAGSEPLTCDRYWWTCYAGVQKEGGKGCDMWQVMDMEKEGRGPVVGGPSAMAMR